MRNNSGFIGLFIFLILFTGFIGPTIGLVFNILPFIFIIAIFSGVIKNVYNKPKPRRKRPVKTNRYTVNRYDLSNKDLSKIDNKLREYFKHNYDLPIFEDIRLVPKGGNYTSFEELYIDKNGEVILSLSEFGEMFPATHAKITKLLLLFSEQSDEVLKAEVKRPEVKKTKIDPKISEAQRYIKIITDLNQGIPQEEITSGLEQTCALLRQIEVSAKDEDDSIIDKLYDYYLPILTKILENYKSLLESGAKGEEFKKCEAQLIKTILLINEALKTINDNLHEDDYMNLSADITTLQSLLKKDGLVKEGSVYESGEDAGKSKE